MAFEKLVAGGDNSGLTINEDLRISDSSCTPLRIGATLGDEVLRTVAGGDTLLEIGAGGWRTILWIDGEDLLETGDDGI